MTDSTISRYLETQIVWARSRQVLQIGNLTAADTELIWHQFTLMTLAREQHCTYTDDSFRGAPICPLMTSDDWRREQTQSSWERVNLSSNAMATTMQRDDQCGICQLPRRVRRHWWQNDWDPSPFGWRLDPGHLGDQQKRGPGQCQSPRMLKPYACWPSTLNWWQDQGFNESLHCCLSTRILWPQHALSRTLIPEWAYGWLKEDKTCEGSPLWGFWGFRGWPAGGLSSLCSHSRRHLHFCSQQHLLVGSKIHCWIKIKISRLAADTIRDTSVATADFFLFGDNHDHQLIMFYIVIWPIYFKHLSKNQW